MLPETGAFIFKYSDIFGLTILLLYGLYYQIQRENTRESGKQMHFINGEEQVILWKTRMCI